MNLKKLNLGLVALLLGFGLVITQSAFKAKTVDTHEWQKYNRDGSPNGTPVLGDENGPFANQCTGDQEVCAVGLPIDEMENETITFYYN